jgi:hypothetical protein
MEDGLLLRGEDNMIPPIQLSQTPLPYRCVICGGTTIVPKGFYLPDFDGDTRESEVCRACHGTGVIWFVLQNSTAVPTAPHTHSADGKGRM